MPSWLTCVGETTDRLEGEEQAGTRRAQARYLARRMLQSEFWASGEQE